MERIEEALARGARLHPQRLAVTDGRTELTYAGLWQQCSQRAGELSRTLRPGHIRLLPASQSAGFLVEYLATHLAGAVAAPLEPDLPLQRGQELEQLCAGSPLTPDMADVMYTTGTTGAPKAVVVPHHALVANADNLARAQGFTPDLTFVIAGPLSHIGSLSKVWPVLWVGASLHILPGLSQPPLFFQAIQQATTSKVATFLVPAQLRMLMRMADGQLATCADKLDFIETGAAPMAHADMQRLGQLLPHTRLYNTYASTETGIVATYDFNDGECQEACVGTPMYHSRIQITPEGRVACAGPTLMHGYLGQPELTREVLHDGWLYTADAGYMDSQGRLRLTGRADDIINVGGYKVSPVEVEGAALALPQVDDCICIARPHPLMGQCLLLLVVMAEGYTLQPADMARQLSARLQAHKVPQAYKAVEHIERTFNGKPNRKYYQGGKTL